MMQCEKCTVENILPEQEFSRTSVFRPAVCMRTAQHQESVAGDQVAQEEAPCSTSMASFPPLTSWERLR